MKAIIGITIELTRLILGTLLGVVLLIIVVSLCKFKELTNEYIRKSK